MIDACTIHPEKYVYCSPSVIFWFLINHITGKSYKWHGVLNHWQLHCLFNCFQAYIKENICFVVFRHISTKTSKLWINDPLWGESTSDQGIPLTKGQLGRKWFHVMMSSWDNFTHILTILLLVWSNHEFASVPVVEFFRTVWYHDNTFCITGPLGGDSVYSGTYKTQELPCHCGPGPHMFKVYSC